MTTIQNAARAIADKFVVRPGVFLYDADACADAIERTFGPIVGALELIAEQTRDKGAAEIAKHALAQLVPKGAGR